MKQKLSFMFFILVAIDLDKVPAMKREGSESPLDYHKVRKYDHETEVIFHVDYTCCYRSGQVPSHEERG